MAPSPCANVPALPASAAPSATAISRDELSRCTFRVRRSPGLAMPARRDRLPAARDARASIDVITSPGLRPALAAALPATTPDASAPSGEFTPND